MFSFINFSIEAGFEDKERFSGVGSAITASMALFSIRCMIYKIAPIPTNALTINEIIFVIILIGRH